jgi:hypothetical protein
MGYRPGRRASTPPGRLTGVVGRRRAALDAIIGGMVPA